MAYFSITSSLIPSIVLVLLLFAKPYSASKVVNVNVVCAQTRDPSFCSNILNSKPGGAKGADLVSLAQYTIGVARAKATNTVNLINMLIARSSSDPIGTAHYKSCLTHFNKDAGALKDIDSFQQLFTKGDYNGALKAATAVSTNIKGCLTGDNYFDKSNLPQSADVVQKVVDIILTITKYLTMKQL